MTTLTLIEIVIISLSAFIGLTLYLCFFTVAQDTFAVINSFGKYRRIIGAGFNFKNPFTEKIFKRISIQNQSMEIEFTATTSDQANVDFKALVLYSVADDSEETLKKVAFKFASDANFTQTLIRSIEASVRAFVASKKQNEVLGIRHEIAEEVCGYLNQPLQDWGYKLIDLQVNDILFDEAIMRSMAQVVSSENVKLAAHHEGEAILIKAQKQAEAEKNAIILKAEGNAQSEALMVNSLKESYLKLKEVGLDFSYVAVNQWMEGMKHMATHGEGNVIFMDGSTDGMERTYRQMETLKHLKR
ncbi:MAG: SPFH domain-containing protein [Flavobacteriales bacterium]